jgi:hypothetical protein
VSASEFFGHDVADPKAHDSANGPKISASEFFGRDAGDGHDAE